MRPFSLEGAATARDALNASGGRPAASYLAGGTTLLDLMKLDVMRPDAMIDINALGGEYGAIAVDAHGLRLGAMVRMSQAADHAAIRRDYRVIADALWQAASPQLRNMASLGGNVLQRTRCHYFRDTSWAECNKRTPGSGCAAAGGVNRLLAVLGTSETCIASYPGDFGVALVALDARVDLLDPSGAARTIAFADLHRLPGATAAYRNHFAAGRANYRLRGACRRVDAAFALSQDTRSRVLCVCSRVCRGGARYRA